ncbi:MULTISPECIES: ROK family protein [unclassified Sphingomonas]|uniref:ROK family protein n=1 Tax=unclassified Sphingomonas TaxID=196159 RepID=UPI0006F6FB04|nr:MULTISPECIES: ROK family protein [unclassified Sphingomonas]KQX20302.1 fructokinase [Sphingomonas sp. Root1294]KQY67552.1 fructokinase [Sphingomonas sp. Root50]KRB90929.1 fructokinase [Sphingomonas sp. Root720]
MDENRLVAGIELGGTKAIALVARGRDVLASARLPTESPATTLAALGDQIDAWQTEHGRVAAIGIASFGPVGLDRTRPDYGWITSTPKPGWQQVDLVGHFAERFGVPIGFDTDVAGAAIAEHRWGAGQGDRLLVYMTIGTGVGGGVLVDGKPIHGLIHPELGHIRVRRAPGDRFAGVCPFHGDCLEGLVSGPAIAARTGMPGDRVGDDDQVWDEVVAEMAEAIAVLMLTLSPQRILIGGGVFQKRERLFDRLRARTADLLGGYLAGIGAAELADIVGPPGLGAMAGPLGAVALAYRA